MMLPRRVIAMIAADGFQPGHKGAAGAATEAAYTGLRVRVLSAPKAHRYRPGEREIAISIRGPSEPDLLVSSRFISVLRLVCADTGEFATGRSTAIDAPDTMTATQADAVVNFLRIHRDASVLVIHCAAGVSRSRSLAAAICVSLRLPYSFSVFNNEVYHLTTRAFETAALP